MFKLLRLFFVVSSISVVVTTTLLTLFYRQMTIRATDNLAQASSLALAQTALFSVRHELDDYLTSTAHAGAQASAAERLAARLNEVVKEFARDSPGPVVRVLLFNRRGDVIFSTDRDRVGMNQVGDAGFMTAINGRVTSYLIYRDVFNRYVGRYDAAAARPFHPPEVPNLMETYVPVRARATESVDAVFESYIDMSPLVAQNQRAAFFVLAGAALVLLLLYGVLILVVRRSLTLIESQHRRISERTVALEALSAKMLRSDEIERKKLAFGLHEGLAQTLVTIKMRIERKLEQFAANKASDESLASVVPLLRSAIADVQAIATGLRPTTLDELGLLPTIGWFCREFDRLYPAIGVARAISLREEDVPAPLKIVIFRIIESVFTTIARFENSDQIALALHFEDGAIVLAIDDSSPDSLHAAAARRDADSDVQVRFGEAQERTNLSGGRFSIARGKGGRITLRASWAR